MTSRHYVQKNDHKQLALANLLSNQDIPTILIDAINKKKTIDLHTIRNIHIHQKISPEDIRAITLRQ